MLKPLSAALWFVACSALAQTPEQTTPSVTPSQTPATTPSPNPAPVPPGVAPVLGGPPPALGATTVGGLSRCENMIGAERDTCLQAPSAAAGATSQPPASAWPQTPPPTGTVPR